MSYGLRVQFMATNNCSQRRYSFYRPPLQPLVLSVKAVVPLPTPDYSVIVCPKKLGVFQSGFIN